MDRRIINLEKDFCWLKAMRRAIKEKTFTINKGFELLTWHHSAFITLTGIIIGALFALGILYLQIHTGFIRLQEEAYYMDVAAVKIEWWQVVVVCIGTLIVSFLVLLIPSFIVRKIQPVKAIRFR